MHMRQNTRQRGKDDDLNAMRDASLRTASNRLKTPVTVLGLALQRLEEVRTEEERRQFLEMALRGQRELKEAVEEVLNDARRAEKEVNP